MHELVNADLFPVVSLSLAKMTTGCRHTHTFIVFRSNCHEFVFPFNINNFFDSLWNERTKYSFKLGFKKIYWWL